MTLANTSWLKDVYVKALKDGSSVAAVSKEGKLMGVRVAKVTRYMIMIKTIVLPIFYRTQVNLGSDLWVRMSVRNKQTLCRLN